MKLNNENCFSCVHEGVYSSCAPLRSIDMMGFLWPQRSLLGWISIIQMGGQSYRPHVFVFGNKPHMNFILEEKVDFYTLKRIFMVS
jgi:hypothetical protein